MIKKSDAIKNFLRLATSPIAQRYNENMEVQVNVAQDYGIRENDKTKSPIYYDSDSGERWTNFRMPFPGNTSDSDTELTFNLVKHAEGIGMSGWDFKNKESIWVGFDFDSLISHKAGLTDSELNNIYTLCKEIPYVSVYKSTSGSGFHLYIEFDKPFPTETRAHHAAVAKSLLQSLTADSGYNFQADVDCCGAILWCWHRKQEGTDGLSAIKYSQSTFPIKNIPPNWEGLVVKKGKSGKIYQDNLSDLASRTKKATLEPAHQAVLKWFQGKAKHSWWWDTDFSMLVCHTIDLVSCHENLNLKGTFVTASSGSSEHNCFAFPQMGGGWSVRRYTQGVTEHDLWETDERGWTRLDFNIPLTFDKSCIYRGGLLDRNDFYQFSNGRLANLVFRDLNILYRIEEDLSNKTYKLRFKKGKILISTEKAGDMPRGFNVINKSYEKVLKYFERGMEVEHVSLKSEDDIRHVISNGTDAGWYINVGGEWIQHNKDNVCNVMMYKNPDIGSKDSKIMMGEQLLSPWKLVIQPFKPEYPGDRCWNKYAAQFSMEPRSGNHSTWLKIYKHLSTELDDPVSQNKWCQENDIRNGCDYLLTWVSSMFQRPKQPLPYLFLWSVAEDTGKSSFHESLRMFFKNDVGYVRADNSLKSQGGFNLELCGGVLCVVEETNLGSDKKAAEKIKDFVTSQTVAIRAMFKDVFLVENTTHWVQCANGPGHCPIYSGDTRIISMRVNSLSDEVKIPKDRFFKQLKEEAPAFLHALLNMDLPEPEGRLGLPTLKTVSKSQIQDANQSILQIFLNSKTKMVKGHKTTFTNLYNAFDCWLISQDPKARARYTSKRVGALLNQNEYFFKGRWKDGHIYLFNISLDTEANDKEFKYVYDELSGKVKEEFL